MTVSDLHRGIGGRPTSTQTRHTEPYLRCRSIGLRPYPGPGGRHVCLSVSANVQGLAVASTTHRPESKQLSSTYRLRSRLKKVPRRRKEEFPVSPVSTGPPTNLSRAHHSTRPQECGAGAEPIPRPLNPSLTTQDPKGVGGSPSTLPRRTPETVVSRVWGFGGRGPRHRPRQRKRTDSPRWRKGGTGDSTESDASRVRLQVWEYGRTTNRSRRFNLDPTVPLPWRLRKIRVCPTLSGAGGGVGVGGGLRGQYPHPLSLLQDQRQSKTPTPLD